MEICDDDHLKEYEITRQRNVISNFEFLKSCGFPLKSLLHVKQKPSDNVSETDQPHDSDGDDPPFPYETKAKKKTNEDNKNQSNDSCKPATKKNCSSFAILGILEPKVCGEKKKDNIIIKDDPKERKDKKGKINKSKMDPIKKRTMLEESSTETSAMDKDINQKRKRHPRSASRVDNTEAEVLDDDHYLPNETKARASLPKGLEIKTSSIPNGGLGVFAKEKLKPGTRFGPYEGEKIHKDLAHDGRDTSYMWEVTKDGDVCYCIDGKDEGIGNWLRFINYTWTETERNLVAYQYHNDIYYSACKHVSVGDELLVWYGQKYLKDFEMDDSTDSQEGTKNNIRQGQIEQCCICKRYVDCNYLPTHVKYCESRNSYSENGKPRINIGGKFSKDRKTETRFSDTHYHKVEKSFGCEICGKQFSHSCYLIKHKRIHSGEKPFGCEVCGKRFNQLGSLTSHQRIHSGEKPFECETCGKRFRNSSVLTRHKRTHSGEKPFGCEICGKRFSTSSDLTKHKRIHSGERPFGCETCGKRFRSSGSLTRHKRTHSREKRFRCEICGKKFILSSTVTKHKRIHSE